MIDTNAVLRFLARSTPRLIESLGDAGVVNYAQLASIGTWFLSAAVAGEPELVADVAELATVLQAAYDIAKTAFENGNPGALAAIQEAGSILVLVPPVPAGDGVTVN